MRSSSKILFLIDGLDEIDGDDDVREELVELLLELSIYSNVKLCVSSRRWSVFQEAFATCPQMRLEALNGPDIEAFVRGQFRSQSHYQKMLRYDTAAAVELVNTVISRAEGVFLWARLVVKELVRGLRDGDSNRALQRKLQSIPGNLDQYFRRLIESIEPHHRIEACALLQIALHIESEFVSLHPLRLIDLIFIDDVKIDFALESDYGNYLDSFESAEALYYKLESTLRRLLSRCKGLLECYHRPYLMSTIDAETELWQSADTLEDEEVSVRTNTITTLPNTIISLLHENKLLAFDFHVDFMHRSLRDYLLLPETQEFLCQYTGGPFDARNYLRNARLVEIFMNMHADFSPELTVGLASYFISTLSLSDFCNSSRCAQFAMSFECAVDYVRRGLRGSEDVWYLCRSLETWSLEQSTFVSFAIDFALTGYLATALTAQIVRAKLGRPLLDYALRPRFAGFLEPGRPKIGNQVPIPELIRNLLSFGADPNQKYGGISIWALFLSFAADHSHRWRNVDWARTAYFMSIEALITAGADLSLSKSALSVPTNHGSEDSLYPAVGNEGSSNTSDYFIYRWPKLDPETYRGYPSTSVDRNLPLSDVLEYFRPIFGNAVENLKALVSQRDGSGTDARVYRQDTMSSDATVRSYG